MNFYSQAGQDRFAWEANGFRKNGVFLDIGCNDPLVHSNTAMLEKIGWTGMCVDIEPFDYSKRLSSHFVKADASHPIPEVIDFMQQWEGLVNYLSMDADDASLAALSWIVTIGKFRCITAEHDVYRLGPQRKNDIFNLLTEAGYERYREDIKAPESPGMPWSGQPFEDWYLIA
jgi:hypothetical protein